jgi:hypothetical protein
MDPDRKRDWRRGSKSASTSIKPILSDDLQRRPFLAEKSENFRELAHPGQDTRSSVPALI